MELKKGGLLEQMMSQKESGHICQNCGNLLKVSHTALGCAAHDKLIMPEYLPYNGNGNCPDWKEGPAL